MSTNNAVNSKGFDGDNRDNGAINNAVNKVLYFLVKDNKRGDDTTEK
jgi:hypothetical protein